MFDETYTYLSTRSNSDSFFTWEMIFVDDGSKDGTSKKIQGFVDKYGADKIRLLKLSVNQGKGGAVQQGMLHSRGALCLMVDADGATRFKDVEKLEKEIIALNKNKINNTGGHNAIAQCHGIAVGSRRHLEQDAVANRAWHRNVLMYVFHFLVSTLTGINHVKDTQCGFKLFTRKTAQYLFSNQHLRRWCFDVELLYLSKVHANSYSSASSSAAAVDSKANKEDMMIHVVEVPVNWEEIPGSKINLLESSFLMTRDLILIRLAYTTGIWKYKNTKQIQTEGIIHQKGKELNQQIRIKEASKNNHTNSSSSASESKRSNKKK